MNSDFIVFILLQVLITLLILATVGFVCWIINRYLFKDDRSSIQDELEQEMLNREMELHPVKEKKGCRVKIASEVDYYPVPGYQVIEDLARTLEDEQIPTPPSNQTGKLKFVDKLSTPINVVYSTKNIANVPTSEEQSPTNTPVGQSLIPTPEEQSLTNTPEGHSLVPTSEEQSLTNTPEGQSPLSASDEQTPTNTPVCKHRSPKSKTKLQSNEVQSTSHISEVLPNSFNEPSSTSNEQSLTPRPKKQAPLPKKQLKSQSPTGISEESWHSASSKSDNPKHP